MTPSGGKSKKKKSKKKKKKKHPAVSSLSKLPHES
jgi:hypothetical protein